MEQLKQFINVLKNNNEEKVSKVLGRPYDVNKSIANRNMFKRLAGQPMKKHQISFIDYLGYTQNIDILKKFAEYVDFDEKTKFCNALNGIIEANGVDLETINKDNCNKILNEALGNFQRNITEEQIKFFDAIITDNADKVEKLLKNNGALANAEYSNMSSLMIASELDYFNICELLIKFGADVNKENTDGFTALMAASARNEGTDIVNMLLNNSANINVQDKKGCTALMYAAQKDDTTIIKKLLECENIQVNLCDKEKETALMYAAKGGYCKTLKVLLKDERVWVNLQNMYGNTVLMLAVCCNCVKVVKTLLKNRNLRANTQNMYGNTALMLAAKENRIEIAKILLNRGVSLTLRNGVGKTALEVARKYCNREVADLILQKQMEGAAESLTTKSTSLEK